MRPRERASWPVAALAGVHVDEAGLAAVQVGVSLEALEVSGLISRILIQAVWATTAEVCRGVSGGGGAGGGGRLWWETCRIRILVTNTMNTPVLTLEYTLCEPFCQSKNGSSQSISLDQLIDQASQWMLQYSPIDILRWLMSG